MTSAPVQLCTGSLGDDEAEFGQELEVSCAAARFALPPKADIDDVAHHVRFVPILLRKSFWGGERKFLEPLMRLTRGDVRDHIISSKIDHGPP
jgi:hypothetical protein